MYCKAKGGILEDMMKQGADKTATFSETILLSTTYICLRNTLMTVLHITSKYHSKLFLNLSQKQRDAVRRQHLAVNKFHIQLYIKIKYYFVTRNQSASSHPRLALPAGSAATNPILAPIHLPSRIANSTPAFLYFFPSRL